MNYNNYGYTPAYQPQQMYPQPQQTAQQAQNTGIVWVQGEAGAKAYPVAAGMSQLLMDSEQKQFYIKSTDMSGMPLPLRIFVYDEVVEKPAYQPPISQNTQDYITREEFEKRLAELKPSRQYTKKEDKKDGE